MRFCEQFRCLGLQFQPLFLHKNPARKIFLQMDNNSIKENIRKFRFQSKLTQSDMADKLGIERNTYRNIESGQTVLIHRRLEDIARILGVSLPDILLGYDPKETMSGIMREDEVAYGERQKEILGLKSENESLKKKIFSLELMQEQLLGRVRDKDELIIFLKEKIREKGEK